jgi:uncharacterized protein (DUF58 family)
VNQYDLEKSQNIMILIDAGRLMDHYRRGNGKI